ncbi:MAG: DUF3134 domain-containing protein [Coleofasciculaceae cyanobacterium]|jgi:hypothetical protein
MYNNSLREEPREQLAGVIPAKQETSLLDWLEANNRLIARDIKEEPSSADEEEISGLMDVEDNTVDDDDSDSDFDED